MTEMDEAIKEWADKWVEDYHKRQVKIESKFKRGGYDDYDIPFFAKKRDEQKLRSLKRKQLKDFLRLQLNRIAEEVIESQ